MRAEQTKKIVMTALFCALSYLCVFITSPIKVDFLSVEIKDSVTAIFGMFFGPLSALTVVVLTALVEMMTISTTGFYGLAMNILSSAAFVLPVSFLYTRKRNLPMALAGLAAGIFITTATMALFNLLVTPLYMGVDRDIVAGRIPTLFLPFNLFKSIMNAGFVLLLYKPVSVALKNAGMVPKKATGDKGMHWRISSLGTALLGVFLVAGSVLCFIFVMNGIFTFL